MLAKSRPKLDTKRKLKSSPGKTKSNPIAADASALHEYMRPPQAAHELQQHQSQPYQRQASAHQIQQSPNLSNPASNQQTFAVQGAYTNHSNLQSPYLSHPSQFQPQQQQPQQQQQQQQQQQPPPAQDNPYYTADPSPRSSNGATYYHPEKQEHMAAAATMQRPPYPPMYHTPQSNSPASVTSPQTHDHGRPMFSQQPSGMTQPMYPYYSPLSQMQTPYGSHNQPSMTPTQMLPNQYNAPQMPHSQVSPHTSSMNTSPRIKSDPNAFSQTPQQRPSMINQQHPTPGPTPTSSVVAPSQNSGPPTGSSAAPGPIPATTPLVVRQDNNGVQWIAFEYSRDRVKMEYTIRCDVESVDTSNLAQEFKSENCVYPRACVPRDQYKGNRLNYESECNQVGWALAELNPCLRGKRGLIQRAVDSWRNSNQDPRLRSRRVRRQAKMHNKNRAGNPAVAQVTGPVSVGLPGPNSMPAPSSRGPTSLPPAGAQIHHHHGQHDMSPTAQDPSSAPGYSTTQSMHRPSSATQHLANPNELRHAQTFPGYQPYPTSATTIGSSMAPQMPGAMQQFGRQNDNAAMASRKRKERDEDDSALFGDLPEGKKRKFILVDDTQKNSRVRVKVTLDQVNVQDIPDSYRKQNSVYPRSYYPMQMQSEPEAGRFNLDSPDVDGGAPTIGRMTVPCTTSEGESQVEVSQLTRSKRERERNINELGYRMAWGQGRVFSNRPIFLARALDAYRTKQRSALLGAGLDNNSIPAHLEVRPGKRRWLEHTRPAPQQDVPKPTEEAA